MSLESLDVLYRAGNISYCLVGSSSAVDHLQIDICASGIPGFSYFHTKFGMPYDFLLKCSIDSGHSLFVAVDNMYRLLGFARFEDVTDNIGCAKKCEKGMGEYSFNLLRSIEVHSSFRHTGIGRLLFAVAVGHLRSNIITNPNNSEATRFFKEKLSFGDMSSVGCSQSTRYKDYLMLSYPRSMSMLKVLAGNYPRMVVPELIDSYESLKFKSNMGKHISRNDVLKLENSFAKSGHLLGKKLSQEIRNIMQRFHAEC